MRVYVWLAFSCVEQVPSNHTEAGGEARDAEAERLRFADGRVAAEGAPRRCLTVSDFAGRSRVAWVGSWWLFEYGFLCVCMCLVVF